MYTLETHSAEYLAVTTTSAVLASGLVSGQLYELVSTTNALVRLGTGLTLTCETKANLVDGETFTLTLNGVARTYEIDKTGDGLTAAGAAASRVLVDISGATTAAQVAAIVKTAVETAQPAIAITDPADGTLAMIAAANTFTHSDTVADTTWAAVALDPVAAAADRNTLVPAGTLVRINGAAGSKIAIVRVSADGVATLSRIRRV